MATQASPLPIDAFLPQVIDLLRDRGVLVVVAEPGAGKTTRIPPAIVTAPGLLLPDHPRVVLLQPRRVAARAAAARIADESNTPLGGDFAGYHVRLDKRLTPRTRIRVLTEGILTRQLVNDPTLDGVGCVILDEFHERSIDADVSLAMLREIRDSLREDLKIVVMSATIDADRVANFLSSAPVLRVPGRTFPIEIVHRPPSSNRMVDRCVDEAAAHFSDSHNTIGDVLVFLPGAGEIRAAASQLSARCPHVDVRELHGSLKFDEQQRALSPSDGRPRCIFATNIAETSLTVDGVDCVIDSGQARIAGMDHRRGLDRLDLSRISKASATQRAGRAGRTRPGKCIRLWTAMEHQTLDEYDLPDIARIDLAPVLLALASWGVTRPRTFGWFEAPSEESITVAQRLLMSLGMIEGVDGSVDGPITSLGTAAARLPLHPRVARVLIEGRSAGLAREAAALCAILSERDFVIDDDPQQRIPRVTGASDAIWRMQLLEERSPPHFVNPAGFYAVKEMQKQLQNESIATTQDSAKGLSGSGEEVLMKLLLLGWPDRVCKRRESDQAAAVMVGGIGVRLHGQSVVREGELFLALDVRDDSRSRKSEAIVRIASRIESAWLGELLPTLLTNSTTAIADEITGKVIGVRRQYFGDLLLAEHRGVPVTQDGLRKALCDAAAANAVALVSACEPLQALLARIRFCRKHASELAWPRFEETSQDDSKSESSDILTAKQLVEAACENAKSMEDVSARLPDVLRARLVYPLDRKLIELAPETIEVPTGSRVSVDYSGDVPVLAVRLQEMFGLAETPTLANGRVRVLLHLLGPNYKAVQVTSDLASFWKNTYAQVRKDLRARYPRHSWPDDPLTALAVRGAVKRRR